MKKIFFLLLLVSLISSGCLPQTTSKNQNQSTGQNQNQNQTGLANPASVYCEQQGGKLETKTDADGGQSGFCIFADGSECEEWSYFRAECQLQSEMEDISGEIKQLFIKKYNKPGDEVLVYINQQTNNYARGGVKFGKDGVGEGGIFLVAKVDGKWQLIFDGNGIISCSLLENYNFPKTMVTDCFED